MTTGSGDPQNMAAHQAAQRMLQQSAGIVQQNMLRRRSAVFQIVVPVESPKTTSLGYEVARTFTIHESEPDPDGAVQWELLADGKTVWVGMGDDRADALLEAILTITGEQDEIPDN